jgi:hypothetical protein
MSGNGQGNSISLPLDSLDGHRQPAKTPARKLEFREAVQADLGCPVPRAKIFFFRFFRN